MVGPSVGVTFSAGVVATAASEAIEEAVSRADALLYEAKAAGRDRVNTGHASA